MEKINTECETKIDLGGNDVEMEGNTHTKICTSSKKIIDAKELKEWAESNKNLQVIQIDTPIANYTLYDIRIKIRHKEDDLFLKDSEIRQRIRRGNCIAEYVDDNQKRYKFARKGLIKFFDYLKKYKSKYRLEEKIVLDSIKNHFNKGGQVYVYLSEKANGENAQIAYEPVVNAWIVASKNVTIVCRNKEDIKWYLKDKEKEKKFSYCAEFADLWFDTLEKNIKCKSPENLDNFINDIMGYTLIAENVGDVNHQHIKLYTEKSLVFYGMIKNDSPEISTPISQSYEILKQKYGLNFVDLEKSPILKSYEEFSSYMGEKYTDILKRDVEHGGEGSVAYFTAVDPQTGEESVLSMGKLKTFEYRFLRKLREKLKIFSKNKGAVESVLTKIENECKDILGQEGDELDLTEWLKFGKFVLNFVKRNPCKSDFSSRYADFVHEMKSLYLKDMEGNVQITDQLVQEVCEKYKPLEGNVKVDDEDEDEGKKINIEKYVGKSSIKPEDKEAYLANLASQASKPFKKGGVYFFIGCTLVGGGKSTLYSIIEKVVTQEYSDLINLLYISSDKMKGEQIEEYLKDHPYATHDDAHDKVSKNIKTKFNNEIVRILNNRRDEEKINIMFVDKNFPKDAIESFYRDMMIFKKTSYEIYVFHPNIRTPLQSKYYTYPFSLSYFIQCYYRIKHRKGHETLDFEKNPFAHHILIGFLTLYNNYKFEINNNKIFFYPLSLSDEKDIQFSDEVIRSFNNMMKTVNGKTFKNEKMIAVNDVISDFFEKVEADYPHAMFDNTIDIIGKEMSDLFKAKVYGKVSDE